MHFSLLPLFTQGISSWFLPPLPFPLFLTPHAVFFILGKHNKEAQAMLVCCFHGTAMHWKRAHWALPFRFSDVIQLSWHCETDWGHGILLVITGQFSVYLLYSMLTPYGHFSLQQTGKGACWEWGWPRQLLSFPDQSRQGSSKQQSSSFKTSLAKKKIGLFWFVLSWQGLKQCYSIVPCPKQPYQIIYDHLLFFPLRIKLVDD